MLFDSVLDRAIGCMVGLAIGNAVGTTVEFEPRGSFHPVADLIGVGPFNLKPDQWTDDTSMALCLTESLLVNPHLAHVGLIRRFQSWREDGTNSSTGECFDIGMTTRRGMSRFKRGGDPVAGATDPRDAGNGSVLGSPDLVADNQVRSVRIVPTRYLIAPAKQSPADFITPARPPSATPQHPARSSRALKCPPSKPCINLASRERSPPALRPNLASRCIKPTTPQRSAPKTPRSPPQPPHLQLHKTPQS